LRLSKLKFIRQALGAAETANWLFLRLLLQDRAAARQYPGAVYREFVSLAGRDRWRAASIFEIFPELRERSGRITIEHLEGHGVITPIGELAHLALATHALEPSVIFEFGTFCGRTALNFALNSPETCTVYTLDLPPDETEQTGTNAADAGLIGKRHIGAAYESSDVRHKIHQLFGESREFDFTPYEGKADLVFVDGGHAYDVALSDTRNALRLCRLGGAVIWHDFGNYGDYAEIIRAVLDCIPADELIQIENTQLVVYRKR
jgi:predicted O-methyltransferase YrrM